MLKLTGMEYRFERFYDRITYKSIDIGCTRWGYMDIGNSEGQTVLYFPGGLKRPLWSFAMIDVLLDNYRVISPCYPPINDLDILINGVKSILDYESIQKCSMIGSSWGGNMVQCFCYKYPQYAKNIVLSNTGAIYSKLILPALKLHRKLISIQTQEKVLLSYKKKILKLWSKPEAYFQFWEALLHRFYTQLFNY